MAQDNSNRGKSGSDCVGAARLLQLKPEYDDYAIEVQSNGEEPLDFDSWLNSKGLRRC